MANYQDIEGACESYQNSCRKLHDAATEYAKAIVETIQRRGRIPAGAFKPHPPLPCRVNLEKNYPLADALRYDSQTHAWELTTFLKVRGEKADSPTDLVRLVFTIRQGADGYSIGLANSTISVSVGRPSASEWQALLDDFAGRVLESLVRFYAARPDRRLGESGGHSVVEFHGAE